MNQSLLSLIVLTPLLGAGLIVASFLAPLSAAARDLWARAMGLLFSLVPLVLGLVLWAAFDAGTAASFAQRFVWIQGLGIEYSVAVDGLSVTMVVLSTLISFVATVASLPWRRRNEHEATTHFSRLKVPGYMSMLLLLQTGMSGTFVARDMFLFFVFWELMLLPMYFLIGIWGGPKREYAAIKFFIYTMAGSVLLLLGMIALHYASGDAELWGKFAQSSPESVAKLLEQGLLARRGEALGYVAANGSVFARTWDLQVLAKLAGAGFFSPWSWGLLVWVGLFIAFAVKVPMVPFHTWLPDAHVEAPTPVSVILAGVLLKMGIYGMLRFNWAILPSVTRECATAVAVFGVINILYAAMICLAQKDLKKLIAYSSVSHMGFSLLGMSAMTPSAISGAVLNLFTHGIISPMLFLVVGVLYDRAHHRDINGFGGLAKVVPEYTALMGVAFFASLGLPGLAGFISEFIVLSGSFATLPWHTALASVSMVLTAAYYLWALQRVFLGPLNPKYSDMEDLSFRERLTLYPLAALTVVFGVYPSLLLNLFHLDLQALVSTIRGA